ncbi:MAG TPA: hypothetical protein PLP01_15535 [Phycisphaerae bacterium]|nr:hypothetical protein [Phycisphaerae bacterium]
MNCESPVRETDSTRLSVSAHLEARPMFSPSVWGPDAQRQQVARLAARIIAQWVGWPNDRLLPEDSLRALLCPDGENDTEDAEMVLEKLACQLDLGPDFLLPEVKGTLSDLVDRIMASQPVLMPRLWPFEGGIALERRECPAGDVFRDLRRRLHEVGCGRGERLRPSTPLAAVIPYSQSIWLRPYIEDRFGCSLDMHYRILGRVPWRWACFMIAPLLLIAAVGVWLGATVHLVSATLGVAILLWCLSPRCFRGAKTLGDLSRLIVEHRATMVQCLPVAPSATRGPVAGDLAQR